MLPKWPWHSHLIHLCGSPGHLRPLQVPLPQKLLDVLLLLLQCFLDHTHSQTQTESPPIATATHNLHHRQAQQAPAVRPDLHYYQPPQWDPSCITIHRHSQAQLVPPPTCTVRQTVINTSTCTVSQMLTKTSTCTVRQTVINTSTYTVWLWQMLIKTSTCTVRQTPTHQHTRCDKC